MAWTNDDIYRLVNFAIRKESKGQPMTRKTFTLLLQTKALEYQEIMYDAYERTKEMTDSLKRFKVTTSSLVAYGTNMLTLPTYYLHEGFLYYKKDGTTIKACEPLDDDQFMMRQTAYIEAPTSDYPVYRMITNYIEYLPVTLDENNFTFSYLRIINTPFYDYYIDVNGLPHYLAVGEKHTWLAGQTDSSGNVKTGAEAEYTSLTVELDLNEEDKLKVAYKILQAVSVPINEAGVFQYAQQLNVES